ncbi:degenerin unc-8-like [Limulus polyphemus]|uniref:Degenerin unc-8-like n=1 Tax=Limulus polyphemus TaxID=6850 RepID=A0ABM1S5B7_LIMPO|nr:degenerin unc-8-like [Limulus polyphemus]
MAKIHLVKKILKSLLLILGVITFVSQVWLEVEAYLEFTSSVSIQHSREDIKFPAMTACSSERFNFSRFCDTVPQACSGNSSETELWDEYVEILERSADKLEDYGFQEDVFFLGLYSSISFKASPFDSYYDSRYGNCFSFNIDWDYNAAPHMKDNIFAISINSVYNVKRSFYHKESPRVVMKYLPTNTAPYMSDVHFMDAGFTYTFTFSQKETVRLPSPYSDQCTDYESLGRANFRKGILTKELCLTECHANKTLELCGCMYKDSYPYAYETGKPLCHLVNNQCRELLTTEKRVEIQSSCKKLCRKPCREKEYKSFISREPNFFLHVTNPSDLIIYARTLSDYYRNPQNYVKMQGQYNVAGQMVTQHLPRYLLSDLVCTVGGVISTWTLLLFISLGVFQRRKNQRGLSHL